MLRAYLAAGEAAHGDDHFGGSRRVYGRVVAKVVCRIEVVVWKFALIAGRSLVVKTEL